MITNKNYNIDLANLSDKKLLYDYAKEMNFDVKVQGNKSTRDRTLIKLFNHQLSWLLGFQQRFYHLILMNFAI